MQHRPAEIFDSALHLDEAHRQHHFGNGNPRPCLTPRTTKPTAARLYCCCCRYYLEKKVNQIGSVTESIKAVKMSKQLGWGVMTSHRSGETEDNYIADIAVGLCTGQIKTGAPCRSERLAKYNQASVCDKREKKLSTT